MLPCSARRRNHIGGCHIYKALTNYPLEADVHLFAFSRAITQVTRWQLNSCYSVTFFSQFQLLVQGVHVVNSEKMAFKDILDDFQAVQNTLVLVFSLQVTNYLIAADVPYPWYSFIFIFGNDSTGDTMAVKLMLLSYLLQLVLAPCPRSTCCKQREDGPQRHPR